MSATNADIIQLSAAHGQDEFNTYIMPEKISHLEHHKSPSLQW